MTIYLLFSFCPQSNLKQLICLAVVYQCRKHTVQYSVEEELVLLCAQSWTSARGNLRMAGAAKPRSPSRVEI